MISRLVNISKHFFKKFAIVVYYCVDLLLQCSNYQTITRVEAYSTRVHANYICLFDRNSQRSTTLVRLKVYKKPRSVKVSIKTE